MLSRLILFAALFFAPSIATAQNNPFNPDFAWCNTQGAVVVRNAASWGCLTPGTSGQVLRTNGAGANASWQTISGTGTVTSVDASGGTTGMTFAGGPVTTAGTLTLGGTLAATAGGTAQSTYVAGDMLFASAANTLAKRAIGSANQGLIVSGGVPVWSNIVNSNVAGTGISVSGATGNVTITNTGVTSTVAGSGISVSGATGAVTIGNTGVLTIAGGSTGLTPASATAGAVTLGGTLSAQNGGTGFGGGFTNGQILIGNTTGGTLNRATITAGSGVTITNGAGTITISVDSSPIGEMKWFAGQTPPTNYLACNGAAISRTTYAALFAATGTAWGAGDGSTTFNIPDMRGRFIRGWDNGAGRDTGRVFGSYQLDAFQDHQHYVVTNFANVGLGGSGANVFTGGAELSSTATGRVASETRPLNAAALCIIRVL